MTKNKIRCPWTGSDQLMIDYHDTEWGIPVHDDKKWFEFLLLEAFQAGLSWKTVLHKRANFRRAFDEFDYLKIADYSGDKIAELLNNKGIIRNKLKIHSTISNAKAFIQIINQLGSFDQFIWQFTEGKSINNNWEALGNIPASTLLSDTISKELKARGFKFVGTTICYSFLQSGGIVNDHIISCYRHEEVKGFQ